MMRSLVVVAVLVGLVGKTHADPAPPPLDDAIKGATKPLILEFSAVWCQPCKVFEQTVLVDPEVQEALKEVVFIHYDGEVSPGIEAANRFGVEAYPSFLVLDKTGHESLRRQGGMAKAAFIELVRDARNHVADEADIRADLAAHPNAFAVHLRAARWFAAHHMTTDALANFDAVSKDRAAAQPDRNEAADAAIHLRRLEAWRRSLVGEKAQRVRAGPLTIALDELTIATVDSGLPAAEVRALIDTALTAQTDVSRLNSMIYIALAANVTDVALAAGERLVGLARTAQFLDTFAECMHVTGDRTGALQIEDEAIALHAAGLANVLAQNRARFDSGTGDSDDVVQLRQRVADLWKRAGEADQLAPRVGTTTSNPRMQQMMLDMRKAMAAERDLAKATAVACAQVASISTTVVANFDVGVSGHPSTIVVLADDKATAKLRACITKELAAATLPILAMRSKRQLTIDFPPP